MGVKILMLIGCGVVLAVVVIWGLLRFSQKQGDFGKDWE